MIKKIKAHVESHPYYEFGKNKMELIRIGPKRVTLKEFFAIFFKKINNDNINVRAKSITYDFFLSIFPGIIFLFTLIPYIPVANLDVKILESLKDFLPASIYDSAESTIKDIISIPRKGLLSFGFIFAFYTANNGIVSIINTFNFCYRTKDTRNFFLKLGISMSILFLTFAVLASGIIIGIVLKLVYMNLEDLSAESHTLLTSLQIYFFGFLRYGIMYFLFLMTISIIYYIAPSVHERWKFFSTGSITASLMCFLFTIGFSAYVDQFNSYNKVYGSIGALIGIMLWIYVNTLMLLVGFQINAALDIAHQAKQTVKPAV